MSHFTLTVISENQNDIDKMMEPFKEYDGELWLKPYLKFKSYSEENKNVYENQTRKMVKLIDGSLYDIYDQICFKEVSQEEYEKAENRGESTRRNNKSFYVKDLNRIGAIEIEVPYKELYATFEEYMKDRFSSEWNEEQQDYGYWHNPQGYYDYWSIGGRWRRILPASQGSVGETSWEYTMDKEAFDDSEREGYYDSTQLKYFNNSIDNRQYQRSIRFWEVHVEKSPIQKGEDASYFFDMYKPEYYIRRYKTKENYAKINSEFYTYAMLLPDGQWYQPGNMGWFGWSDDSDEAYDKYREFFKKTILEYKEKFPDYYITVLDCHI